jgi:hypothetical protein
VFPINAVSPHHTSSTLPVGGPDSRRTKRTIEYRTEDDKWDYIGGTRRLPGI